MGPRVAMVSGGKDSLYALMLSGGADLGLMLLYEFPRPSPHILNLSKSVETILLTGTPVIVAKLTKGRERDETVRLLKLLGASKIIAGDVYIEDHLKYMESIASEVGAELDEPLWGMDPLEVLYREVESGIETVFIGSVNSLKHWLGRTLNKSTVEEFVEDAKRAGVDPLGEHGEYHTLVISSPLHRSRLTYSVLGVEIFGDYSILRVV